MANPSVFCFFTYTNTIVLLNLHRKLITFEVPTTVYKYKATGKNLNHNYICRQCNNIMSKRKLDVACSSSHPKLTKLTVFGFSTNSSDNTVTEPNDKPCSPTSTTCSASSATPHYDEQGKNSQNFLDSWKLGHPWLRCDKKFKQMFCDVCIKAKFINSFTTGCDILKRECVTKHESRQGNNSHTRAQTVMRDADIRNKLCISSLENLMRISMYRCEKLDFETAFNKWAAL